MASTSLCEMEVPVVTEGATFLKQMKSIWNVFGYMKKIKDGVLNALSRNIGSIEFR